MGFLGKSVRLDIVYQDTLLNNTPPHIASNDYVEFPVSSIVDINPGDEYIPVGVDVDLTDRRISYRINDVRFNGFATESFNGYFIRFNEPSSSDIVGVAIDSNGTLPLNNGRVRFDSDGVYVDVAGLSFNNGDTFNLEVSFEDGQIANGSQLSDLIRGTNLSETITAYAGDDTVSGNYGSDLIYGNQGNDQLYGNQDADTLYGGQGRDSLYGGIQQDILFGNFGDDQVFGNLGTDTLYGGQGNDALYGGRDDDWLSGDLGDDVLSGDLGADTYVFGQNSGRDLVLGFSQASGDRLSLGGQTFTVGTSAAGNTLLTLSGGGTVELQGVSQTTFGMGAGYLA